MAKATADKHISLLQRRLNQRPKHGFLTPGVVGNVAFHGGQELRKILLNVLVVGTVMSLATMARACGG